MSRIMAIDYGDKRIGLALSDNLQIIASGYKTIQNNSNSFKQVYDVILEKEVTQIVLGMPFDSQYKIGFAAKKVLKFACNLNKFLVQNKITVPFYEQDEAYSTVDAYDAMNKIKIRRKRKQKIVDQIAAATILKDFMETKKKHKFDLTNYD